MAVHFLLHRHASLKNDILLRNNITIISPKINIGFPGGSEGKESDLGSTPGLKDPLKEGASTLSTILACRIP